MDSVTWRPPTAYLPAAPNRAILGGKGARMTYFLFDQVSDGLIGVIGGNDVRVLINDPADTRDEYRSYTYDAAELDELASRGADPGLLSMLRAALGGRERGTVCWGRRHEETLVADC